MDSETRSFRILMFPWLAHGHIFPYLELAKRIVKKKSFHIYLCSTAINFSSINNFIHTNSLDECIQLVELHLQPNPQLPPHHHTTKNLPSNLNFTLLKAFQTAKSSFSDILSTLKPDLVIFDIFQPWAATLTSSLGIPAVHFVTVGAAATSFRYHHRFTCSNDDFPFPELHLRAHEKKSSGALMEFLYANVFDQDKDLFFVNFRLSSEVVLLKTSRALEGKYIDYVSSVCHKRILAVSPLVTDVDENEEENSGILQWLSKKNRDSTLYISFGSENFLSKEEREEIAKGLELCEVNFVWVIRFPVMEKTVSIEEALPEGFLDCVKNRGMVVQGWAPQAAILAHPSVGGFMSHCGWSSVTESVYLGVPVVAVPLRFDQPLNARLMVEAGVAVEVIRDENGQFDCEGVANAINEVAAGESGERLRMKARELSEKMKMEEQEAINEVAEELSRICLKNL